MPPGFSGNHSLRLSSYHKKSHGSKEGEGLLFCSDTEYRCKEKLITDSCFHLHKILDSVELTFVRSIQFFNMHLDNGFDFSYCP